MIFQNCLKFHSPNGSWNYVKQFRNIARCIYAKYHYKSCYYLYQYALGVGFEFTLRVVARSVFVWNCTLCWPDVLIVRKSSCSLFLRAMHLAVVFKCYSITNNHGLNNKFSSYSWDAIINRKKKLISSSGSYTTRWDKRKFYLAFLQNSVLLKLLNFSLQVTSVKKVRS